MKSARWVIIDTETDGLYEPIHVVELSGQLMDGWEPIGEPFRMLLNHDVQIPEAATAIHGYTSEFLKNNGTKPLLAHEAFRDYAGDLPLVAHNLSFDWNRCLVPEWERLGIREIGQKGFCTMMLARRLEDETKSYRLDALKETFKLTAVESHRAKNDVLTLVELFRDVYRERLESAGLNNFEAIAEFSRRTPVAKCLSMVGKAKARTPDPVDSWYFLDGANNVCGPLDARSVASTAGSGSFYVWREGLAEWVVNTEHKPFLELAQSEKFQARTVGRSSEQLIGLCKGLLADDRLTTNEVRFLGKWLEEAGVITEWPASEIAQLVESILEDGVVSMSEKRDLKNLIERVTLEAASSKPSVEVVENDPHEERHRQNSTTEPAYARVDLAQGTPEWLAWRSGGIGASDAPVIMGENPWKSVDELLATKLGLRGENEPNEAMLRGLQLEPEARDLYITKTGRTVSPACVQSLHYEWLRASIDGMTDVGDAIMEIKCGESAYRKVSQKRRIPDYYYGQVQHALAVTGLKEMDFWCYWPEKEPLIVVVPRDDEYIERLLKAEQAFWQRVVSASASTIVA